MYLYFGIEDIEDIQHIHVLHKCKNKSDYVYCDDNCIVNKKVGINPKESDISFLRKIKIPNNTKYLYVLHTKAEEERGWHRICWLEYFFDTQSMLNHIKEYHMSNRECSLCNDDTCEYCLETKSDYDNFLEKKELTYLYNPEIINHIYRRIKI